MENYQGENRAHYGTAYDIDNVLLAHFLTLLTLIDETDSSLNFRTVQALLVSLCGAFVSGFEGCPNARQTVRARPVSAAIGNHHAQ
jgi:hypothetical protein